MSRLRITTFALSLALLPCAAEAAEGPAASATDQDFDKLLAQAKEKFNAQQYKESLATLQSAYALYPLPRLHQNMARCHQLLGQRPEELQHLELFLNADPDIKKDPELQSSVQARIATLREELGMNKQAAAPPPPTPVYKRWWLWTTLGAVAAGTAAAIAGGVLATRDSGPQFPASPVNFTNWTALTVTRISF